MAADLIPWIRYWRRDETVVPLPASGFLSQEMLAQAASTGAVSTLRELTDVPCLILLGEPGLGKTRLIQQEERDLAAMLVPADESRYLDLGAYSNEARLWDALAQGTRTDPAPHVLHLFLDSFDECQSRIPNLGRLVVQFLRDHRTYLPRLRLRIASRTLDWPRTLEEDLRVLWDRGQVGLYHLLPLTQEDVRLAAEAASLNPNAFLQEIQAFRAEPLAATPLTLNMLLNVYCQTGTLGGSQAELFENGCLHLLEESHRAGGVDRSPLATQDRLEIATRIGAMLLFCGRVAVQMGAASIDSGSEDLRLTEIQGGHEEADGRKVAVTPEAVADALKSGLFVGVDDRRVVAQHKSFTEFLAARFLTKRGLKPEEALGCVTCKVGKKHTYVVPQLAPVASWLANLDGAILDRLVDLEPQVVLQSDSRLLDDNERARLVDALLGQLKAGEREQLHPEMGMYLQRLRHPGLAEQLRPTIVDHDNQWPARAAAIEIAEACVAHNLQDALVTVALGKDEIQHLRLLATHALATVGDERHLVRLLPLATGGAGDDPLDDLRARALRTLRGRGLLRGDDLFVCITLPSRPQLLGSYAFYLMHDLPESLEAAELPAALRWAIGMSDRAKLPHAIGELIQTILQRAADSPASLESEMALVVSNCIKNGTELKLSIEGPRRRAVLEDAIHRVPGRGADFYYLRRLLTDEDTGWISDCAANVVTGDEADKWFVLVRSLMRDGEARSSDEVIQLVATNPLMAAKFRAWVEPVELESPEAKRRRADYLELLNWERDSKAEEPRQATLEEVDACLARVLDRQESEGFNALLRLLELQDDGGTPGPIPELDPEEMDGWHQLDDDRRERVRLAAGAYLRKVSLAPSDWDQGVVPIGVDGYRALVLLGKDPRTLGGLPERVWTAWCPVILRLSPLGIGRGEAHTRVLQGVASVAREAFGEVVRGMVMRARGQGRDVTQLLVLKSCWNEELGQVLLDLAHDKETHGQTLRRVLGILLENGYPRAEDIAIKELKYWRSKDPVPRSIVAAAALLMDGGGQAWGAVIQVVKAHANWGKKLMAFLSQSASGLDVAVPADMDEESLADLYLWLGRHFAQGDEPVAEGVSADPSRIAISHFRDRLLRSLQTQGTEASVEELGRIADELPDHEWVRLMGVEARRMVAARAWAPLAPEAVLRIGRRGSDSALESATCPVGTRASLPLAGSPCWELPGLKWSEISMDFLDGETVRIRAQHLDLRATFAEMGFKDGRSARPNAKWLLLQEIADNNGFLPGGRGKNRAAERQRKHKLTELLMQYFRAEGDPFGLYVRNQGWEVQFKIRPEAGRGDYSPPRRILPSEIDED